MGLILYSTVCVHAEREGLSPFEIVTSLPVRVQGESLAMSVITLSEISFGLLRAESRRRVDLRRLFLTELQHALPAMPVTGRIAIRAGFLRAALQRRGEATELADLLIAATALELDFAVATSNVRHFRRVPGLRVVEL